MEEGAIKYESELEKYSGVGVFKHKIKIWMILDEFTITLWKFEKRSSCIGSINVYDIQIVRKTGHKSGHEFEIKTNTKHFTFIAQSNDLATEWVKFIQKSMSKRITSSSTVVDPERGRNRREAANPLPDMPDYDKSNKFGVTLKPLSRTINKSASTASSDTALDKTKAEFKRTMSVPTEADKTVDKIAPISNSAGVKVTSKQPAEQVKCIKLNPVLVPKQVASPPPCSPVREETIFAYGNGTAGDDKNLTDENKSTTEVTSNEEIAMATIMDNKTNSEQNKDNRIHDNKPGKQLTSTSGSDKDNTSWTSDTESSKPEETSDDTSQVKIRNSRVQEVGRSQVLDNESNSKQNKDNIIDKNKPIEQVTTTSDIDKDNSPDTESSKTEDTFGDTSQVEMRKSHVQEPDVVMRKSTRSHVTNISQISQSNGGIEADCLYDDIAYVPVYPAQDSSDEGDADNDDAIVDAFDDVFNDRDEPEPVYYSYPDNDEDKSYSAFTRLKEYLENNCEFRLETHAVSVVKPLDMLRNHLIK